MNLRIVVDSTFNLDSRFIEENRITVVPLNVIINGESFRDDVDVSIDDVMNALQSGKKVSSSQPSPATYVEVIETLKEEGATDILCLTISSTLSGTYQSAIIAQQEVEGVNFHVVDTLSTSVGAEIIAELTVEKVKENYSIEQLIHYIEHIKKNSGILMNFENLNTLKMSGRITRIKAAIGNLIKVKPIIEYINGKVLILNKLRTEKNVVAYIVERIKSEVKVSTKRVLIYISHANAIERVVRVAEALREGIDTAVVKISRQISPVIAINLGYGGIGVAWCYE
ncbi:MAG: DegV family protein [Bacilli bacterium]|jgi:DegV family protein with EDD domain|nr:DegV family protein [Bacilli bacterium]